jgi:hypothetical protein
LSLSRRCAEARGGDAAAVYAVSVVSVITQVKFQTVLLRNNRHEKAVGARLLQRTERSFALEAERIVAVALLTERDVSLLGATFDRLWSVEKAPDFAELLRPIDWADPKLNECAPAQVQVQAEENPMSPASPPQH